MENKRINQLRMNKKNLMAGIVLSALVCSMGLSAQSVVHTSGGSFFGINGSVSYSVGQVFHAAAYSAGGSLYAGIQVPMEVAEGTGTDITEEAGETFSIYPNPANERITISLDEPVDNTADYILLDMPGRVVASGQLRSQKTEVGLDHLGPSVYLLRITRGDQKVSSFKIIKK